MEPMVRIELTTDGLRNRCSTTELHWPKVSKIKRQTRDNYFGRVRVNGKLIRRPLEKQLRSHGILASARGLSSNQDRLVFFQEFFHHALAADGRGRSDGVRLGKFVMHQQFTDEPDLKI
jgi:hypothetical protein